MNKEEYITIFERLQKNFKTDVKKLNDQWLKANRKYDDGFEFKYQDGKHGVVKNAYVVYNTTTKPNNVYVMYVCDMEDRANDIKLTENVLDVILGVNT